MLKSAIKDHFVAKLEHTSAVRVSAALGNCHTLGFLGNTLRDGDECAEGLWGAERRKQGWAEGNAVASREA